MESLIQKAAGSAQSVIEGWEGSQKNPVRTAVRGKSLHSDAPLSWGWRDQSFHQASVTEAAGTESRTKPHTGAAGLRQGVSWSACQQVTVASAGSLRHI